MKWEEFSVSNNIFNRYGVNINAKVGDFKIIPFEIWGIVARIIVVDNKSNRVESGLRAIWNEE